MIGIGIRELITLVFIIALLHMTGLWSMVVRGIRELRGDAVPPDPPPGSSYTSAPPASASDLELCYRMLGLSPSAPWADVEKAYLRKAKIHHPDHGGDADAMRALNEAYARLKRARSARR